MRAPIAKIKIAAGNPGWYDPLTNIHLTITRPESLVFEGQNTTNIKNAVFHKLVFVVEGDLNGFKQDVEEEVRVEAPEVPENIPVQEVEVEEIKEPVVEEKVEEVKVEEKKPAKKATTKKKATAKTEKTK